VLIVTVLGPGEPVADTTAPVSSIIPVPAAKRITPTF